MRVINIEYSVDDEDYNFELEIPKDMDKDQGEIQMKVIVYKGFGIDLSELYFVDQNYNKYLKLLLHPVFLKTALRRFNESTGDLHLLITNNHRGNIYLFAEAEETAKNQVSSFLANSLWHEYSQEHDTEDYPYLEDEFKKGILTEVSKYNLAVPIHEYTLTTSFAGDYFVPNNYYVSEVI